MLPFDNCAAISEINSQCEQQRECVWIVCVFALALSTAHVSLPSRAPPFVISFSSVRRNQDGSVSNVDNLTQLSRMASGSLCVLVGLCQNL